MKLLIGNTELNVTNAWVEDSKRYVLIIVVPQTEITHDNLVSLLNGNTGDITKTNDDGTVETLTGFHYSALIADYILDGMLCHKATVECTGEGAFQAGRALAQAAALAKENAELKQQVSALKNEGSILNASVLDTQMAIVEVYEQMMAAVKTPETDNPETITEDTHLEESEVE